MSSTLFHLIIQDKPYIINGFSLEVCVRAIYMAVLGIVNTQFPIPIDVSWMQSLINIA